MVPYGIYDVGRNQGWVSVGIDHDTAEFAIDSILAWWRYMGSKAYPKAQQLLILADAGGSNASRSRLWKFGLQRLANITGLHIHVSHFPPRHQQMEQDRASHVLFRHPELARKTFG